MTELFHPIAYVSLLVFAGLFFFLKERNKSGKLAGRGFALSAVFYGLSLFFEEPGFLYTILGVLTPDLAFLAVVVLFFNRFAPKSAGVYFAIFAVFAGIKLLMLDPARDQVVDMMRDGVEVHQTEVAQKRNLAASGELLLDLNGKENLDELQAWAADRGLQLRRAFPYLHREDFSELEEYYTLDIPKEQLGQLEAYKEELRETGYLDALEENEIIQLSPLETRTANLPQRGGPILSVNDPAVDKLWGFKAMGVHELHKLLKELKPKKKAKVAILDTGVEGEHEDLKANYVSTSPKYDSDKQGHGTHCAGIAAAVSNNGKGIASFAPDNGFVEVTSIKVLSDQGWGTQQDIINGIIKAADEGADVISLSLGGPSNDSRQRAYSEVVKYAQKSGAIVVVAAGNSSGNAKDHAPASAEGVLCISAVDEQLQKASFSNTVEDLKMGLAAPGVNIYSTFTNGTYQSLNGTSMATPYVSGLLGIMKALKPELTTEEAYEILNGTGKAITDETGALIQAEAAVQELLKN